MKGERGEGRDRVRDREGGREGGRERERERGREGGGEREREEGGTIIRHRGSDSSNMTRLALGIRS